jgi:hypothetical protein
MGALTPTSKFTHVFGDRYVELYALGTVTDGDTLVTGLTTIEAVIATGQSAATAIGVTFSGSTITFHESASVAGAYVAVIGT